MIAAHDYATFLEREYLRGYVDDGGAAVKFVLPVDDEQANRFSSVLRERAEAADFTVARVDAAITKVHLIEQVFFAVSRQIPWDELADSTARRALEGAAYPVAEGDDLAVEAVAIAHGVDPARARSAISIASSSGSCTATTRWSRSSASPCCGSARPDSAQAR